MSTHMEAPAEKLTLTVNPSGIVTDVDERLCVLLGRDRDEFLGKNLAGLLGASSRRLDENRHGPFRQSEEAPRSEFLARLSHDLLTPLGGILGFAELMHDGKLGYVSPLHREYLGDILLSARHMLHLISGIDDRAGAEEGQSGRIGRAGLDKFASEVVEEREPSCSP